MLAAQEGLYIDNSFTINHFSFGSKADFASIKHHYPGTDIQHPLDGFTREVEYTQV